MIFFEKSPLCRICNPAAFSIRIYNPLSLFRFPHYKCSYLQRSDCKSDRAENPTEQIKILLSPLCRICNPAAFSIRIYNPLSLFRFPHYKCSYLQRSDCKSDRAEKIRPSRKSLSNNVLSCFFLHKIQGLCKMIFFEKYLPILFLKSGIFCNFAETFHDVNI